MKRAVIFSELNPKSKYSNRFNSKVEQIFFADVNVFFFLSLRNNQQCQSHAMTICYSWLLLGKPAHIPAVILSKFYVSLFCSGICNQIKVLGVFQCLDYLT